MDVIRITDEKTGTKYVFRGDEIYRIVDGKEVLVKEKADGRKKDTSDRSRK